MVSLAEELRYFFDFICLWCCCKLDGPSSVNSWVGHQPGGVEVLAHEKTSARIGCVRGFSRGLWVLRLGPHPAQRHPEGIALQSFQNATQFSASTGRVLLDEDAVHQVSVLLVDLNGRLTHFLQIFILRGGKK